MQVCAIQGSPRKNGNTDILLDAALAELRAAGAKVKKLYLRNMKLGGCIECFACQRRKDRPNCAVKDDVQKVYREMLRAELIVFATPVFCWGPSAQMKAVLDRCYALCKFREDGSCDPLLAKKRSALVVTAAGDRNEGANIVVVSYRRLMEFMEVENLGELVEVRLGSPDSTRANAKLLRRAAHFGKRLAEKLG